MNKKIGVAIAGCGQITRTRHAPEYSANPNAEIIGFYDRDRARAEELAEQDITPSTIRVSIGTENAEDIIWDLKQAFAALDE